MASPRGLATLVFCLAQEIKPLLWSDVGGRVPNAKLTPSWFHVSKIISVPMQRSCQGLLLMHIPLFLSILSVSIPPPLCPRTAWVILSVHQYIIADFYRENLQKHCLFKCDSIICVTVILCGLTWTMIMFFSFVIKIRKENVMFVC